jgi:hypothetical protein
MPWTSIALCLVLLLSLSPRHTSGATTTPPCPHGEQQCLERDRGWTALWASVRPPRAPSHVQTADTPVTLDASTNRLR